MKTLGTSKAKVSSKGQITLPKNIREALKIDSADTVIFTIQSDGTVNAHKNFTKDKFWSDMENLKNEYGIVSTPEIDWGEDVGTEVID